MKAAILPDRGVVTITGADARQLLNGLVTSDVSELAEGAARFAALLTPQGKIVADFLVVARPDGLALDCPKPLAASLATKLNLYKLRAKVTVADVSEHQRVVAFWDGESDLAQAYRDPRDDKIGQRAIIDANVVEGALAASGATRVEVTAYEAHRIALGVPRGGSDFIYGDAFPHETNMDRLHGVDFDKGCYVGQEVVSRMEHRGTARTRSIRMIVDGPAPEPGINVEAGGKSLGMLGSSANGIGVALLRIDRVADAIAAGHVITAGGVGLRVMSNDDLRATSRKLSA